MAVLKTQALSKSYSAQEVVAGVSFAVLLAYALLGFYAATVLFRRRVLK
jgi:hypothetical protein